MSNILVTGSSGTIGTRLCERLLSQGQTVIGIDKVPNKWNKDVQDITLVKNLNSKYCFIDIPKDISTVIHLAANARVYNSVLDPDIAKENIDITYNILEFCRKNSIKNFLFASSRETYGNKDMGIISEKEIDIANCESPYSASKIAGESFVNSYQKCYDMNCINCRFSNVYGMYDDTDRLIPLFISLAKQDDDIIIFGEEKCLDFTYIDDAVNGVIKLVNHFPNSGTFNISKGEGVYLSYIVNLIKEEIDSSSKVVIKENREGEILNYVGDISLAKNLLNFSPQVSIVEGVRKSVQWYKNGLENKQ